MTRESDLARRSSEIRRFFRTTVSNKAVVSQFLLDAEGEITEYEIEIDRLRTARYALENKRDRLKKTAELYKSLLSPIHSAPTEILTTIFAFACEENVLSRSPLPAVLRLSMVCGRWRDLVLSTPSLWRSISIDFGNWNAPDDLHVLNEMTKRFMRQSKQCPLRLSLEFPVDDFDDGSDMEGACPTMNALIQNCRRWETVSLSIVRASFPYSMFDSIRGQLPLLRSLHTRITHPFAYLDDWDEYPPFNYFDNCPSLRETKIDPRMYPLDKTVLPWPQIKTLRIQTGLPDIALPVLSRCQAVEEVELSEIGDVDEEGPYCGHVVSHTIRALTISRAEEQCDVDDVLHGSTFGGLSSLEICGAADYLADKWSEWNSDSLQAFLLRSSCAITSLHLQSIPVTDVETLSLLRFMPTLESLYIEEFPRFKLNRIITKKFLDGLVANGPSSSLSSVPFLPRMSRIKLVLHAGGINSKAFLKALSSRWLPDPNQMGEVGVECLRSVTIVVLADEDFSLSDTKPLDCLRCFKNAGMRLTVTYGKPSELYPEAEEGEVMED
ncbi:hypothetical protein V5O48_003455 [Marasmius crinis-equi]|uniref:F-box domain-containing protein n=1 Tax=Marasmius crinis-equi TaxID=585013 RepID=A0ABR3FT97_9AGAR